MSTYQDMNVELCRRIQTGDKSAETELVVFNDGLVRKQVNKVKEHHMLSHMYEYEDCVIDCQMALIEAAKRYEYKANFSTYAVWFMLGAVSKNWEEKYSAHLPKHVTTAHRMGRIERHSVIGMINNVQDTVSLDDLAYVEGDDEIFYEDLIEDTNIPSPEEAAAENDIRERLFEVLKTDLTERERKVLILRFGLDGNKQKTLEEVAKAMYVTRERVRQIEAKALRKLRHPMRAGNLGRECCLIVAHDYGTEDLRVRYADLLNPKPVDEPDYSDENTTETPRGNDDGKRTNTVSA